MSSPKYHSLQWSVLNVFLMRLYYLTPKGLWEVSTLTPCSEPGQHWTQSGSLRDLSRQVLKKSEDRAATTNFHGAVFSHVSSWHLPVSINVHFLFFHRAPLQRTGLCLISVLSGAGRLLLVTETFSSPSCARMPLVSSCFQSQLLRARGWMLLLQLWAL